MIRIIVADDNARLRASVRGLVQRTTDMVMVGEACDGEEAIRLVKDIPAEILILDIEMPRMNGIEVLEYLQLHPAAIRVMIFSGYTDRELIEGSLELGARAYLIKEEAPACLLQAIREVSLDAKAWLSAGAAQALRA